MNNHAFRFLVRLVSVSFVLFLSFGCSTAPSDNHVPTGEWGGLNVDLKVAATGASAQFKCGALGEVRGPLVLDGSNHFDVNGTYDPKLVLGGPRSARFTGTVNGTSMALSVEADGQSVGSFQLTFGVPGSFEPCNF